MMAMTGITLSCNEIRAEVEKAIRGGGGYWGQAKDGGVMAAYLAAHDLPFLDAALRGLDAFGAARKKNGGVMLAMLDGMMVAEYTAATSRTWSGEAVALPFLLAAMGIVACESHIALCLRNNQYEILAYADSDSLYLGEDTDDQFVTLQAETVPACGLSSDLRPCHWSVHTVINVSGEGWQHLGQYAAKIYVKETEEKRRGGAGAGDIDNS
jgi:hypothetical protein